MLRKFTVCTLLMMFLLTSFVSAQSFQEMTVLNKTTVAEKIVYGTEQTGSLIERTAKIEKDLFGSETREALTTKLDRIYNYLTDNSGVVPSFQARVNAVEWTLTHNVTSDPAKTKIENIEMTITGNSSSGNFDDRVEKLAKLAYPNGQVYVSNTTLYKDTLIKIKTVNELDSRKNRQGDVVIYQATEDVYSSGLLVIPKGMQGTGTITKVQQARNFGRDAALQISFDTITAFDGTIVKTEMGDKAKEETKSLAKAAGASVAGMALLGPIGVVGGAFVHGSDITIPAGTEMYIQVNTEANVYGLQVK
ncbi:hypothetical protein SPFL3102_01737 [Sporomusaceae bacterium FL31]|nr:hypothetical protein SPFL3101_03371 [Sporomusaceae bacterium FL31]GCE33928.1 hypothetical protein SPFL3102_01737 [Sporomusaceae bacterium]